MVNLGYVVPYWLSSSSSTREALGISGTAGFFYGSNVAVIIIKCEAGHVQFSLN